MSMRFGLRTQALLAAAFLLLVPLIGWLEANDYERRLIAGQERRLLAAAEQAATTLEASHRAVLDRALAAVTSPVAGGDLYAYPLTAPMVLDGKDADWGPHASHFAEYRATRPDSLGCYLGVGRSGAYLYILARVLDDRIVYREVGSLSVHRNDHVQVALITPSGEYDRYTIAPMQPGIADALLVTPVAEGSRALRRDERIDAVWLATADGYNVEIRIPMDRVSNRLSISVTDVDDPQSRDPLETVGSASTTDRDRIGVVILPSPPLAEMLGDLVANHARIRLVDAYNRLVAESGDIARAGGFSEDPAGTASTDVLTRFARPVLLPLLPKTNPAVVDEPEDPRRIGGNHILAALAGHGGHGRRRSGDGTATILSAAWPIYSGSDVAGAIVVEETTNHIIELRNRMAIQISGATMMIILLGAAVLLAFSSIISGRIGRLRRDLESSTDSQGRVRKPLPASTARDELGQLARSLSAITSRLQQYNRYLEDMSARLAHELRTPLTVIRSSLDNLSMQDLDADSEVYVSRADEGVQRLAAILTNMTEATRLEESLNAAEVEFFDLTEVVRGCVRGYELAYPEQEFDLSIEHEFDKLSGLPDLIAQMLDKLVSNAVEFALPNTPVRIRLTNEGDAVLRIINRGPRLPEELQDRLFDSMISVRQGERNEGSHLGLGLYIARIIAEFHGGSISAHNREDAEGVIVTVRLPIMRITGRL